MTAGSVWNGTIPGWRRLVAFCPAADCAEKGGELVSVILRRLERWHGSVDPAWYRYAGLPAGTPSHRTARVPSDAAIQTNCRVARGVAGLNRRLCYAFRPAPCGANAWTATQAVTMVRNAG